MKKLVLFLFFTVLIITIGLISVYAVKTSESTSKTPSNSIPKKQLDVNLKIISTLPEYKTEDFSIEQDNLNFYLTKLGLETADLNSITVIFKPLATLTSEKILLKSDSVVYTQGELSSDGKELVLSLFTDISKSQKNISQTERALSYQTLFATYAYFQPKPLGDRGNPIENFEKILGIFDKNILKIKTQQSFLHNFTKTISDLLIPEVQAQSCPGTLTCGNLITTPGHCSISTSKTCSGIIDCPIGESCAGITTNCVPVGFDQPCQGAGGFCQISCLSCVAASSCNYIPPVNSTPAPTPGPGGCTDGGPTYGVPNCGTNGLVPGAGSCGANCLCCKNNSGPIPDCSANNQWIPQHCSGSTNGGYCNTNPQNCTGSFGVPPNPYSCCTGLEYSGVGGGTCQCCSVHPAYPTNIYPSGNIAPGAYNFSWDLHPNTFDFVVNVDDLNNPGLEVNGSSWRASTGNTSPFTYNFQQGHTYRISAFNRSSCGLEARIDVIVTVSIDAWWQVKDGDVTTNGNITSLIPSTCTLPSCNPKLILDGTGGFPGAAIYGGNSYDFSGSSTSLGSASSKNWLANSSYGFTPPNYSYFTTLIPSSVIMNTINGNSVGGGFFNAGGSPSKGYVWYKHTGDLTINGNLNLSGNRKVVLFIEGGNLTISSRINIGNPGQGFFMAIAGKDIGGGKGNILVDPSVTHPSQPALEGIFYAEDQFLTGTGNNKLYLRGSVAALGGVILQRDLGVSNLDTPAEFFEYAPELMMSYPRDLGSSKVVWKEVAP